MPLLQTPRLDLVPATAAHLRADLQGRLALERALAIDVPPSWPPEFYDEEAIRFTLTWLLAHPGDADWGFYYLARRTPPGAPRLLVGAGGFKGGPDDEGTVEVGYSILREHQRQGYATEAVVGWARFAFESPKVARVIGQTLQSLGASIRVLEKAGFRAAGVGHDPHAPEGEQVLRYELSRESFLAIR
jgi:RimJ/RimL family protein N-acetyltransferase